MKLPIVGPSYEHPSISVNNQRCLNMFVTSSGPEGKQPGALVLTPGLQLLYDLDGNETRCLTTVGNYVYAVVDSTVYKLTVNELTETATASSIGTIGTSTGVVYAAVNNTQIMWVDGSANGYIYTPGSGTFQEITATDADFPGGTQVVCIDGYFIVNDPSTGNFYCSALNNGLSWDATDVATAESSTDNIVGLKASKGDLWIFGERTTEIWYDAANASGSPFSPRDGLELQMGCIAPNSIADLNDLLVWVDHRGFIVQSNVSPFVRDNNSGYQLDIISTEALTTELLSYARLDDAVAMVYNDRGHLMYEISFPTAKKTWAYDYMSKMWHERSYYNTYSGDHEHHLAQFYTQYKNLHIMGGVRSGKIYLSKPDIYTDDSLPIRRVRTTPFFYDQEEARLIGIDKLELKLESGLATQSGDGSDPQVTMRYSNDGGHTWSSHLMRSMGLVGQYAHSITWNRLGIARDWMFEFTFVEPIKFAIIECFIKTVEIEG